ncbi:ABC transporter ATP-binding protein [uncultured Desulfobacter sp.]|uniref:ABC transporter ATP-binding protein n=1 Tax=uncultured Desulfobacter sp. TaxID=240139 RepID=UPI002AA78B18|nr:ABC transporter ATP-binding protein [uncultured Desulfobacter sp.]
MNTTRTQIFKWLFANAKGHRLRLVTSMVLASISAVLAIVPMICVYLMAKELFEAHGTATGPVVRPLLMVAAGAVVLRCITYLFAMICSHVSAYGIHFHLRGRIAAHLARLPMGFFDKKASGATKKVMLEDMENMEPFIAHYLPDLASALVLQAASAIYLFWINPVLALAALLPVPLAAIMHAGMNRVYRDNVGPFHDNMEAMNNAIVEYVRGMPVIKAFNRTARSFGQYRKTLETHLGIAEDWSNRSSTRASLFWVCLDLGLMFILPAGFFMLHSGQISGAELVLFLLLGTGLMEPVGRIIMITSLLDRIGEGMNRVQALLDQAPLPEPNALAPNSVRDHQVAPGQARSMECFDHTIEFCHVTFGYGETDVLKDISFVLPQGSITGLVGPSGAGKSTTARLAARFWDAGKGKILMGGRDIKDIPMHDLMDTIAFVFQDVYLMNDTIMENIRMGNPKATDEQVKQAAKDASAHGFITALPKGYRTMAGEGGAHLSGGEKQRISIARAILKDAPILILDEITSATDPENERHIHQALNRLMTGKTVLVIAHKLTQVRHADHLLLFENGCIRAQGRHEDLLGDNLYSNLWHDCTTAGNWKLKEEANVY